MKGTPEQFIDALEDRIAELDMTASDELEGEAIEAATAEELGERVIQFSIDVQIPDDVDTEALEAEIESRIADIIDVNYVAGIAFVDDVTDAYERDGWFDLG